MAKQHGTSDHESHTDSTSSGDADRQSSLTRRIASALFLPVLAMAAIGLVILAIESMNTGTLVCFLALAAWVIHHEWWHLRLDSALELAEKRIRALEEFAGIRRQYDRAVRDAAEQVKFWKGMRVRSTVAKELWWPFADDMAQWRRAHWEAWTARQAELRRQHSEWLSSHWTWRVSERTPELEREYAKWESRLGALERARPFIPPPEDREDRLAYWDDYSRWTGDDEDEDEDEEEDSED